MKQLNVNRNNDTRKQRTNVPKLYNFIVKIRGFTLYQPNVRYRIVPLTLSFKH